MTGFFAHESSYVDEGANIGEGTRIWHFCHVMPGARIGSHCNIGQNVFIAPDVVIGNEVRIQNNVSVYTGMTIEDGAFLGPSVVFTNVVNPRSHISRKDEYSPTLVMQGASIGANATIVCGVTLGRYAFVGAGAVVSRDLPDYALAYGNPARVMGWMCECGTKLNFEIRDRVEKAICKACGLAYIKEGDRVEREAGNKTEAPIPLIDLAAQYRAIQSEIERAMREVLESGQFILGPNVAAIEQEVADYLGVKHAAGVASGTDALVLTLQALKVGAGDEVLVPAYAPFITAEAVLRVGAKPVFADIEPDTYCLDVRQLEAHITGQTKAAIPVHLFGHPVDMTPLLELAEAHDFKVIEDNAQGFGAEYQGRRAGGLSDAGCLSFFPTKNLSAFGDGGMVVTNDDALIKQVRLLRTHGWREKFHPLTTGYNSRLDEIQAAILRVKLRHLDGWLERRHEIARLYAAQLADCPVGLPHEAADARHSYHLYVVRVGERDKVRDALRAKGIASGVYYPLAAHLTEPCRSLGYQEGDFPVAEQASRETLALPFYPEMPDEHLHRVAGALKQALSAPPDPGSP